MQFYIFDANVTFIEECDFIHYVFKKFAKTLIKK